MAGVAAILGSWSHQKQGIGVLEGQLARAGTSQRDACLPSCSLPVLTGVHIPAELGRVI